MTLIGVKFCGSCNPVLDTMALFEELKRRLPQHCLATKDYNRADIMLILSGCESDCATRPEVKDIGVVVVAGYSIDREGYPNFNQLADALVSRLTAAAAY